MKSNTNTIAREVWLTYFNNVLFEKGIISEKEKNKMSSLINSYCCNDKIKS